MSEELKLNEELNEDTTGPNAPNIASTDENLSVDLMFQQSAIPSLGRQIFSVVPINGPTGALFNIGKQSGTVEISTILCEADVGGSLNDKYWTLSSPTVDYYVWYNVNSAGSLAPIAGKTAIEVTLSTGATAVAVATATAAALNAVGGAGVVFTSVDPDPSALITVTNTIEGEVTTCDDGDTNWGDAWIVTQAGTGIAEVTTIDCEADTAGSLGGKYFTLNSPSHDYYVWMQTGEKEVNTLICGTAAQTDMTGTKEVNTIVAEADSSGSLDGNCFHFFALDGNNGNNKEYYCFFDVDDAGNVGDPIESGTAIKVVIATDDADTVVAAAVRAAIDAAVGDLTVTGAGASIILTGVNWGVSAAAADGTADTGWSSFTQNTPGVDINAGDHLIFYTGLNTSSTKYYVWFNATGGSAAGTAPSLDPEIVDSIGIQIDHAFNGNAAVMGTALRAAVEAVVGATGNGSTIITGASASIIITDALLGVGTIATTGSNPTGYSISRTNIGTVESTDPVPGGIGIEASFVNDASNAVVATAVKDAIDALDDFGATVSTAEVTVTNAAFGAVDDAADGDTGWTSAWTVTTPGSGVPEISTVVCKGDTLGSLNNKYWTLSTVGVNYYVWYSVNGQGSLAPIASKTEIKVEINTSSSANDVALATQIALDTLDAFEASVSNDTVTITNTLVGAVTDTTDGDTGWANTWVVLTPGAVNDNEFELVRNEVECYPSEAIKTGLTQEAVQDLFAAHGKQAKGIVGKLLRGLANEDENIKTLAFLAAQAKAATGLILTASGNAETVLFEVTKHVQEIVLLINSKNLRSYETSVVLPYKVGASLMALSQYASINADESRGLFITQMGQTKYYIHPTANSLTGYVILKDTENHSKSSAIFSPYMSNVIEARNPDTGALSYHIFNRYAITASPLHVTDNEMIYSFAITL